MVSTSEEYNKSIYKSGRKFKVKAKITLLDNTVLNISNEDIMQGGVTIEDGVSSPNSFEIGSAVIGELTLVLNNLDDKFSTYDFYGATIYIQIGLFLSDNTIEFIPKGYFTVDEALAESATITLTALDNMSKFDKPYSKSTLKYPSTLAEILGNACSCCGVSLATQTFLNSDYTVKSRPDDEKTTFREMVSWIAQLAGSFVRINYNGEFALSWYDYSCFDFNDYLDGGNFIDYSSGDTADGGNFKDYSSGDIYTGGVFKFTLPPVYITKMKSCEIATDDIKITGVQIVPVDEEAESYISGEDGYVITIEENPLAQSNIESLTYSIGQQLNGFTFRQFTASSISNPAAESGDVALIIDRKGNRYQSIVSNLTLKIGGFESFSGDADTPNKKESSRYSASAKAVQAAKKETEKQISNYDLAVQQLSNLMANAMGVFETVEKQEDGSVICYAHDKPTLSESRIIWKKSRDAFAVSFDGGATWHGMTAEGNIVAQILTVIGINADWINAGSVKAENISQEFKQSVTDEIDTSAESVTQAFQAADGVLSSRISSKVGKDEISSTINQTAQSVLIDASKINLSGYATFSSLSSSGETTINGDNITTGTLNANLIQAGKIVNPNNPNVYFDLTNGILASSKLVGTSTTTEDTYASIGMIPWSGGTMSNGMVLATGKSSFLGLCDKDTGSAFQPVGADISSPGNMSIRCFGSVKYPSSAQAQNALDLYKTDAGQGQLSLYRANGNSRDEVLRADEEMIRIWCQNGIIQFVTGEYVRANIKDNGAYFGDLYTHGIKVTSDRERKTAIQNVQFEAIEKIKQLDFYSYQINKFDQLNRSEKGKADLSDFQFVPIGIMYDEAPEEIKAQNEKAIDLYPYLCLAAKSIQELCTKVENLENRIKQLKVKERLHGNPNAARGKERF